MLLKAKVGRFKLKSDSFFASFALFSYLCTTFKERRQNP